MYDVPMYYVLFIFCFKDNVITMTIWDKVYLMHNAQCTMHNAQCKIHNLFWLNFDSDFVGFFVLGRPLPALCWCAGGAKIIQNLLTIDL